MVSRNSVNIPPPALQDLWGCSGKLVSTCNMHDKSDVAMYSIIEANGMRVLHKDQKSIPSQEELVFENEAMYLDGRFYVTREGLVSAKGTRSQPVKKAITLPLAGTIRAIGQ